VSSEERDEYKKNLSAGVNVMTGFGTVFFVRPKDTRFDSVIDDAAERYTLRNNGNTVVVVDEFRNCSLKDETECEPTTKHHILAGKTFEFEKSPVASTASIWSRATRKRRCASPASNDEVIGDAPDN